MFSSKQISYELLTMKLRPDLCRKRREELRGQTNRLAHSRFHKLKLRFRTSDFGAISTAGQAHTRWHLPHAIWQAFRLTGEQRGDRARSQS